MRKGIKLGLVLLAGSAAVVATSQLRHLLRQSPVVAGKLKLDATNPMAMLDSLSKLVGDAVPDFPGFVPNALLGARADLGPRTVGELREEIKFVELIRAAGWPVEDDSELDVIDEDFRMVLALQSGGKATLVEHDDTFRVVAYITPSGVTHDELPVAFNADGLDYGDFMGLVYEHKLDDATPSTEPADESVKDGEPTS